MKEFLEIEVMIGNIFRWLFLRYIKWILGILPVSISDIFISFLSHMQLFLANQKRMITVQELLKSRLLNDIQNPNQLVYQSFRNQNQHWIKMCYLPKINRSNVEQYLQVEGSEYLEKALDYGKGVILLNPHFGPFLFALAALGYRGYKINQLAIQGEPKFGKRKGFLKLAYEAKFDSVEKKMPVNFINAAENPMVIREVIKRLRKNEIVFIASTGRAGITWHKADFLGRAATFNLMPFKVALSTGASLLPVFALESKPIAHIVIERPLSLSDGDTPEKVLERYINVLSSYVKRYPNHFAQFLYEMHVKAWRDDHPFFSDYPKTRGLDIQASQMEKDI